MNRRCARSAFSVMFLRDGSPLLLGPGGALRRPGDPAPLLVSGARRDEVLTSAGRNRSPNRPGADGRVTAKSAGRTIADQETCAGTATHAAGTSS